MKARVFYILIGCMLPTISIEAYGRQPSCCVEPSRTKNGEHGVPGYFEDGEHGKNGQNGGHGGNGGSSIYGNGGDGGNGGDAE